MPVIIISSLTQAGSAKAMEALQAGAVDVMDKPSSYSAAQIRALLADTPWQVTTADQPQDRVGRTNPRPTNRLQRRRHQTD
jgi:two-component system chemotaxis response regulator CheB